MRSFWKARLWLYLAVVSFFMTIFQSFPTANPSQPFLSQLGFYIGVIIGGFLPWILICELVYQLLTFRRKPKPKS